MSTPITGYRQLSEDEVALINRWKRLDEEARSLIGMTKAHLTHQRSMAGLEEGTRLDAAEPERWLAMARTDIQVAVMKGVRSIAQPGS